MTGFLEAPVIESGGGYPVSKSVRFRASVTPYFDRTPTVVTNRRTWTWSGWVKRGRIATSDEYLFSASNGSSAPGGVFSLWGFNLGTLYLNDHLVGTGHRILLQSSQVFRDVAGWYHVLFAVDTPQATATDRVKAYVCGVPVALSGTWPSLNLDTYINDTIQHRIGQGVAGTTVYPFDGYITEVRFIDGQALTPASFGQFDANGVWTPKAYTGTYGTNGFYLPFNDGSSTTNLGLDRSGNGNNYTATNVSLTAGPTYDWMDDTPTNNFATWNTLSGIGAFQAHTAGNLSAGTNGATALATVPMSSGNWYAEFGFSGTAFPRVGVADETETDTNMQGSKTVSYGTSDGAGKGELWINGVQNNALTTAAVATDIYSVAYNAATRKVWFAKNGVWQNFTGSGANPATDTNPVATLAGTGIVYFGGRTNTAVIHANFGQRPFAYTPPSGFKALCTANLPAVTVPDGRKHFDALTHSGNGSTQSVVGAHFQPDFAWVKARNSALGHILQDSVRGTGKSLFSNSTTAETGNAGDLISAFTGSGINVTTAYLGGADNGTNGSGLTYADWLWKAGGAPVTNNAGSISAQVSANTTAGFSIVTYTGTGGASATVGHGLGVAPKFIVVKERSTNVSGWNLWAVYHASTGANQYLALNQTSAAVASANAWNNTAPTASVFSIAFNAGAGVNYTSNYVAYCFSEIPGYSKFGSYTGNGSTDGPFVFCGFRPRFVMFKRSDAASAWVIYDTARDTYNPEQNYIQAQSSATEAAAVTFDVLSNGFKCRTAGDPNVSGGTYVYVAFAENPFGGNNVAPATAR